MHILLKIIGCVACAMAGHASVADPFSWELAEVNMGRVTFEDGTEVRYRAGHIYSGNYVEVSVVIDRPPFGPDETDLVLFEAMALNVPKISAYAGFFVVEDTGTMWGQYEPTTHFLCWRPGAEFVEVECPTRLKIDENLRP